MIQITRSCRAENSYSEWMRTGDGQLAGVCCVAREEENAALYAYAYTHAIMTMFRQSAAENVPKAKNELAEMIMEYCKYAWQKLDMTLEAKAVHPVPYIGGFLTISSDKAIAFTVGNAAVRIAGDNGGKDRIMKRFSWLSGFMKRSVFSGKHIPVFSVKIYPVSLASFRMATLLPVETNPTEAFLTIEKKADAQKTFPLVYRAVITGRRHSSKGQYCQDYADSRLTQEGMLAAALSDGAGGGSCSEYGARMNVEAFLICCEDGIPSEKFGKELLRRIKDTHEALQEGKPVDSIQAYATLLGISVKDDALRWWHIGDGAIYGRKRDGTVECISDAENFQVSTRTYFTIEADASEHLYEGRIANGLYDKILLMSDGVYNGYREDEPKDAQEKEAVTSRMEYIRRIFDESDAAGFDDTKLADLIDTQEILRYGDDHSALLLDFGRRNA